jgi:hypothetical protein
VGWKRELTGGAHASVRGEREGAKDGRQESKKKMYYVKYAKGARGPMWQPGLAGLISIGKFKGFWFLNLNRFHNLARLWEFLQGDLEGIWTQGFFLNSSRLLKDFWKIQYAMPWMQP